MLSGAEYSFPIMANPRLVKGSPAQLDNIEISPFGLYWPDLDEDLSFRGIIAGEFGQTSGDAPLLIDLAKEQTNQDFPAVLRRGNRSS